MFSICGDGIKCDQKKPNMEHVSKSKFGTVKQNVPVAKEQCFSAFSLFSWSNNHKNVCSLQYNNDFFFSQMMLLKGKSINIWEINSIICTHFYHYTFKLSDRHGSHRFNCTHFDNIRHSRRKMCSNKRRTKSGQLYKASLHILLS